MADSAAYVMKLVNVSSANDELEGSGEDETSEVKSWKRSQLALLMSHLDLPELLTVEEKASEPFFHGIIV